MIDEARKLCAEVIIIAGDLFDTERVSRRVIAEVLDLIGRASKIEFLYLKGNHEGDVILGSGIELPKNLKIFGDEWTYFDIGDVTFAGRSEITRDAFSTLSLDEKRKNIVVLHGALQDRTDKERIGIRDLEGLPIDYLALGHYHSFSEHRISKRCTAVYSGTPEGRGFDEAFKCGFVLLRTAEEGILYGHIPFAQRQLHIVKVDVGTLTRQIDLEDRILASISGIPLDDMVRVVLVGEHETVLERDCEALSKRLMRGRFYLEVKDESRIRISMEDYKNDISLKGEFIRMVLCDSELSEKDRDAVIELGLRALAGEGL